MAVHHQAAIASYVAQVAAVSFDGSDTATEAVANETEKTGTFTVTNDDKSNRLLVAIMAISSANTSQSLSTCTLNGVSATGIVEAAAVDGGLAVRLSYAYWDDSDAPSDGSHSMVATYSASVRPWVCCLVELSGVDQTTPIGTIDTDTATDQTSYNYSLSLTSPDFAISAVGTSDSSSMSAKTAPSGTTKIADIIDDVDGFFAALGVAYGTDG